MTIEFFKEFSNVSILAQRSKLYYCDFDYMCKASNIFLSLIKKFITALSNTDYKHICCFEQLGYEIEVHTHFPKHNKETKKKLT